MSCALISLYKFIRSTLFFNFKATSFRSVFFILAFVATMYRAMINFVCFNPWEKFWLIYLGLALPVLLQFIMFSLLILFLAKSHLMITGQEHRIKYGLYPAYSALLLLVTGALIPFCVWISTKDIETDNYDDDLGLFIAGLFGGTAIALAIYGYLTHRTLVLIALSEKKRRKIRRLMITIMFYCMVFIARAVWNITKYFNVNELQDLMSDWLEDSPAYYYSSYLVFYALVEVLPTGALIVLLDLMMPGKGSKAKATSAEKKRLISGSTNGDEDTSRTCIDFLCCGCDPKQKRGLVLRRAD